MISGYALRDVLKRSQHPVTGDWVPIDVHIELAADHDHHYAIAAVAEHVHHIRTLGIWQTELYSLFHGAAR